MVNESSRNTRRRKSASEPAEDDVAELELGVLPTLVARQLRIAQLLVFKGVVMEVGGVSLSPGSFEILELLNHNPGIGPTRLALAIGLEKSSLVPAIARLEDLGLVVRKQSTSDKRANELRITGKGKRTLAELRSYVMEHEAKVTKGLSSDDVKRLNSLLQKIASINS